MNEPTKFRAGTTVEWTEQFGDYPASSGWSLVYYIRGAVNLDITAVADGAAFNITITAAQTATLAAGNYVYTAEVSLSGEVFEVSNGTMEVLVDLAEQPAGYDGRTFWRRYKEAIEALLENRATKEQSSIAVAGGTSSRSLSLLSPLELRQEYQNACYQVKREENQERIDRGLGGKKYYMRFR